MTEHQRLIALHLERMRQYLEFSYQRTASLMPVKDWSAFTLFQNETLAAFRVRFSEFQEHLGKTHARNGH